MAATNARYWSADDRQHAGDLAAYAYRSGHEQSAAVRVRWDRAERAVPALSSGLTPRHTKVLADGLAAVRIEQHDAVGVAMTLRSTLSFRILRSGLRPCARRFFEYAVEFIGVETRSSPGRRTPPDIRRIDQRFFSARDRQYAPGFRSGSGYENTQQDQRGEKNGAQFRSSQSDSRCPDG